MITFGNGLFNKALNSLPVELHIPGYQFCGPGTRLAERLARGDSGINPLDSACMEHDIAYSKNRENMVARRKADTVLGNKAWKRFRAKDSTFGEKTAALSVASAMKLKSKLGLGLRKKRKKTSKKSAFCSITKAAKKSMKLNSTAFMAVKSALDGARKAVKRAGGKTKVIVPRILSSKSGGALPFSIPLFAGLSATGALAGGAASVIKAVNAAKAAQEELKESKRHNKTMESIAIGKGLYLKAYRTGLGLYLKPYKGTGLKKERSK